MIFVMTVIPVTRKAGIFTLLGVGYQNPQLVLQKLSELRDAAVAAGSYAQGFYIQSGVTIYRVGQSYLTVGGDGRSISYVQNAIPGTGVVQRYVALGGR